MNDEEVAIVLNDIIPIIQNGQAVLFLGAGYSAGTPTLNDQNIPGTTELIRRILLEIQSEDVAPEDIDLQTAFSVGEDEIDDFLGFLTKNFLCKTTFEWQRIPFRYWWRRIYTTNIDNVIDVSAKKVVEMHKNSPHFEIFNYKNQMPPDASPLKPPIVYLHGRVTDPDQGFVFDRVSYADHSIKPGDWLHDAALYISFGNCIIVASKLKETDLETEMRKRNLWCNTTNQLCPNNNYIILESFNDIERKNYIKRGIIPIRATAEEFFRFIENNAKPLSPSKLIKRIAPHLRFEITDDESFAWFAKTFNHVGDSTRKAKQQNGIYSRFFTGDMPDWFYIVNKIPAKFRYADEVIKKINKFLSDYGKSRTLTIFITGRVATGKTTLCRLILHELSKTIEAVYEYDSFDGINVNHVINTIRNTKGTIVLFFDKSSEHFYAIDQISNRYAAEIQGGKLLILIEERDTHFQRNKHHLKSLTDTNSIRLTIPSLEFDNAILLYESLKNVNLTSGKLIDLSPNDAAKLICDTEQGFRGDLLATMLEVTGKKSYQHQLTEEYDEIEDQDAKEIYKLLSIVTAARLSLPITFISEILSLSVSSILSKLREILDSKIYIHDRTKNVSSRHHLIAEYHTKELISDKDKEALIVKIMSCVSKKFNIDQIRTHPLPYRIYKAILHHKFLSETVFTDDRNPIEGIYSYCQNYFKDDAIFWLQYGLFLYDVQRYPEAEHCYRKGLAIYDSFQIRNALGQVLLKLYSFGRCSDPYLLDEAIDLFRYEISTRGETDPYPYTTCGHGLMDILQIAPDNEEVKELLKDISNEGLKHHRSDDYFSGMIKRGISKGFLGIS